MRRPRGPAAGTKKAPHKAGLKGDRPQTPALRGSVGTNIAYVELWTGERVESVNNLTQDPGRTGGPYSQAVKLRRPSSLAIAGSASLNESDMQLALRRLFAAAQAKNSSGSRPT